MIATKKIKVIKVNNEYVPLDSIIEVNLLKTELFDFITEKELTQKEIDKLIIFGSEKYWIKLFDISDFCKNKNNRKEFLKLNPDYDSINVIISPKIRDIYTFNHISLYKVDENYPVFLNIREILNLNILDFEYNNQEKYRFMNFVKNTRQTINYK